MVMRTMQALPFTMVALAALTVIATSAWSPEPTPTLEAAAHEQQITACGTSLQSAAPDVAAVGVSLAEPACEADAMTWNAASLPVGPWGSCRGDCSPCLSYMDCQHPGGGSICDSECM
jgi:hypothetical protein